MKIKKLTLSDSKRLQLTSGFRGDVSKLTQPLFTIYIVLYCKQQKHSVLV